MRVGDSAENVVLIQALGREAARAGLCFFIFYFSSSGGWGKIKLKLTTLACIFVQVVRRFNSIAFAIQLVFWRVVRFPR